MTTGNSAEQTQLATLINLLSCNDLDVHEVDRIVNVCRQAKEDPIKALTENYGSDAAQIVQYDPQGVIAFIVFIELEDYFAVSDTVDELYEQIVDAFETPTLPDYPYDTGDFVTLSDYYRWLDKELLIHHPKYCLISFGQSYTHDFQTVLVYRDDVERILQLCDELGLAAERCE